MRGLTDVEVLLLSARHGDQFEGSHLMSAAAALRQHGRIVVEEPDPEGWIKYETTPAGKEALRIHYALAAIP